MTIRPSLSLMAIACAIWLGAAASRADSSTSMRDTFVETAPGVRIHAVVAGAATNRPTLVLIPGWRLTASIWREQIGAFAADRQVVAIDPRSEGASTKTPEGDTPEERARDLHAVLKALGGGDVVLVGWSQGVQDVAAYVNQFGVEGLKGVVLVDSTISAGSAGLAKEPDAAARTLGQIDLYIHNPRAQTEGMMRAIIRRPLTPAEFETIVSNALETPSAIGAAMLADDLLGPDRTPAIAKMTVPVLVIASAQSPELEGQRRMAARAAHGRFEAIENAGHAVFVDQPERFDALLRDFMSGLG